MIIGSAHSLVHPKVSALQRALSCFSGAEWFARFDSALGNGGLYYSNGEIKPYSNFIAGPAAVGPTSNGMLVDGSVAPTLVHGYGPNIVPNGDFETDASGWTKQDSSLVAVGGERVVTKNAGVNYGYANVDVLVEVGKTYRIRATVRCGTCDQIRLAMSDALSRNSGADNTMSTSPVQVEYDGVATSTNLKLQFVVYTVGAEAATAIVDGVYVEEVLPYAGFSTAHRPGSEALPNGDFSNGTIGWFTDQATQEVVDGRLKVTSVINSYAQSSRSIGLEVGATYLISGHVEAGVGVSSAQLDFWDGATQHTVASSSGADVFGSTFITVVAENCVVKLNQFGTAVGREAFFDNISVRRVYRDQTVAIVWDADGTTGDRVVWSARKDANDRLALHFVSGILRLESFVAGVSEGFVGVPGVDDGGRHSATLYWDEVSKGLSVRVDGGSLATVTATNVPTNLNQFALGHLDGVNHLNGLVLEHVAANGDQIAAWQDIPI